LEAQLWDAADKMRGAVPPTDFQQVCLGMADIRKERAETFRHVQHPDHRADYVLANRPFALFGQTAKRWCDAHPDAEGNLRDHAPLEQLVVPTNLESLNSLLIRHGRQ
jgi:type I restriction-modification system DNA methylase subunit